LQFAAGHLDAALRVRHRQTGPPCEVVWRGGPARGEVTPRQLEQCLLACDIRRRRRPFVQQGVRELLPTTRAAAQQGVELTLHDEMAEPLARDALHARALEVCSELG